MSQNNKPATLRVRFVLDPDAKREEGTTYLECEIEKQCPCCGAWAYVPGSGRCGIGFDLDAPELRAMGQWFAASELDQIPGYLRDVAEQDLKEARHDA